MVKARSAIAAAWEPLSSKHHNKGKSRPPLKTFAELCEMTGVSPNAMVQFLARRNGPKPVFKNRSGGNSHQQTWYEPREFMRWFRAEVQATSTQPAQAQE